MRILLIETASPKRVCEKAEQILRSGTPPPPEVFVLCSEKNSPLYRRMPGITAIALPAPVRRLARKALAGGEWDKAFAFWTGEKRFRSWKILGLRLGIRETYILSGDTNEFRLTWKAIARHALFRLRHPLPTDHGAYATPEENGEKILLLQSAEPYHVIRALERLQEKPLFLNPAFTLFCRNEPETVQILRGHPALQRIILHVKARNTWTHWRRLRTEHFDAVVLFLTGNPSFWKVKIFAFLLGTRRILIFNETSDCFFFNFQQWLSLIAHRLQAAPDLPRAGLRWSHSARILVSLILKSAFFPIWFLWVSIVWIWLRLAGLKASGVRRDCSF